MENRFITLCRKAGVSTVLDIGSRDGAQAAHFKSDLPGATVIAFEPNPAHTVSGADKVLPKAVLDYTGETEFYAIQTHNTGASSIYEPDGNILPWDKPPVYTKITVPCVRLDDYGLAEPTGIWMDVQGAENQVLDGLGESWKHIRVIATEIEISPVYRGSASTLESVFSRLIAQQFYCVHIERAWEKEVDAIFVRKELL